jgi:hypothetical protein
MVIIPRLLLSIAAVAPTNGVAAFAFGTRLTGNVIKRAHRMNSSNTSTSTCLTATTGKEICETTMTEQGKSSILCTVPEIDSKSSLWSDVAINAAKQFTISQRQK